jgi:hypothetical protein
MFYKTNIEKFINFVIANVELLKLFKCLDALDVLELTPANVEESHVLEGGSNVTKTRDD